MARKKTKAQPTPEIIAPVQDQLITDTIEKNYMPYVMSVIVSRAIPEIDGFKPAHRKILYTMYKMGLMHGARTKSANVVGQTMHVHPHGDMAIYETLVRLTRANEALLHPFVDSKGSFGKQYSRDMAFSAPRYTEVKLDPFCAELFAGIEKNAVDMVPNYDNTMVEPTLLPTTFPNILVSPNMGIAVGMASQICSFNLAEICDGTIALLKNPKTNIEKILDLIKAPDFSGGAQLIYDRDQMREIYQTGRGSVRLRARYEYDKQNSCIDIVQIPYSTSIEAILKSVGDLVRDGKIKEITDYRDEIDLNGFTYSPYAVAKLYGYWIVKEYREAYNMYCCSGILFNHESERRGETFVTRKITLAAARIAQGKQDKLYLGNLSSLRDWGYAKDYVECMWLILQQEKPEDFVIATGKQHSVREFCYLAFKHAGIELEFQGEEENEVGIDKATGRVLVEVSKDFYRPTDVVNLWGDPTKAKQKLGWNPGKTSLEELVRIMVDHDMKQVAVERASEHIKMNLAEYLEKGIVK